MLPSAYPKWLSISLVRDEQGHIRNHIGSFIDISELKATQERIRHLAHHDTLTNLPKRFSLQEKLKQAVAFCRRNRMQLAVMLIDLDRFKTINDTSNPAPTTPTSATSPCCSPTNSVWRSSPKVSKRPPSSNS